MCHNKANRAERNEKNPLTCDVVSIAIFKRFFIGCLLNCYCCCCCCFFCNNKNNNHNENQFFFSDRLWGFLRFFFYFMCGNIYVVNIPKFNLNACLCEISFTNVRFMGVCMCMKGQRLLTHWTLPIKKTIPLTCMRGSNSPSDSILKSLAKLMSAENYVLKDLMKCTMWSAE